MYKIEKWVPVTFMLEQREVYFSQTGKCGREKMGHRTSLVKNSNNQQTGRVLRQKGDIRQKAVQEKSLFC